jgi:hypothetical protein
MIRFNVKPKDIIEFAKEKNINLHSQLMNCAYMCEVIYLEFSIMGELLDMWKKITLVNDDLLSCLYTNRSTYVVCAFPNNLTQDKTIAEELSVLINNNVIKTLANKPYIYLYDK